MPGRAKTRPPRVAGWSLVLGAVVLFGWSAWTVWQDEPGARTGPDHTRDAVLRAARQEIAALNTMNPAQVAAGLRAWSDAATGPLRKRFEAGAARTPSGWRLESLTAIPAGAR